MNKWQQRVYVPCVHRGQLIELVQVCACTGKKQVGVYPCEPKGQCTVSVRHKTLQTCISCPHYQPSRPSPQ